MLLCNFRKVDGSALVGEPGQAGGQPASTLDNNNDAVPPAAVPPAPRPARDLEGEEPRVYN